MNNESRNQSLYRLGKIFIYMILILIIIFPTSVSAFDESETNYVYLPLILNNFASCNSIPTLISPSNGEALSSLIPLFQYETQDPGNATAITLEIAQDPDFNLFWGSLWTGGLTGEFRFPRNFSPNTTYYWRGALLCDDIQGPYTETWSFTTGSGGEILTAPNLISPSFGSSTLTQVTLKWEQVSGAVEYYIFYREKSTYIGGYTWQTTTNNETTIYLDENTTYEWRVSARNDYAVGEESETWEFTTNSEKGTLSNEKQGEIFYQLINDNTFIEAQ